MTKYQFVGPSVIDIHSVFSYMLIPTSLQLVASACCKKCMKLYPKETGTPPCAIHSPVSVKVGCFDKDFH